MESESPGRNESEPTGGLQTDLDPEGDPSASERSPHGMSRADRGDMTLRQGGRDSTVTRACSAWRNLPRPREKYSGAGPTYVKERREGGGRVAVAMNWGNSRGAKEPELFRNSSGNDARRGV